MADRKITDLTALTTPASADVLPIVDVSEAAAADKNKKITVGELFKGVPDGTAAAPAIAFESDDGNGIFLSTTDTVGIATNGSSRMTVSTTAVTSTLPVIVPDGTAAAPSVAFTGSGTDTGFYSAAANTLAASTGGTNALYIDSSQRVGIGSASPSTRLQVHGSWVDSYGTLNITGPDDGLIGVGLRNSSTYLGGVFFRDGTAGDFLELNAIGSRSIRALTNGSEALRIDSDGRLLVGTSSDVSGDSTNTSVQIVGRVDNTYGALHLCRNDSTVASSNPIGRIEFRSNDENGTYESHARIEVQAEGGIGDGDKPGRMLFYTTSDASATPTERMRIDSSGRVGIGTTSPGSFDTQAHNLVVGTGSGHNGATIYAGTDSWSSVYFADGTTGSERYRGIQAYDHSVDAMLWYTAATERARIDSSGRLLVGTSSARTNFYNTTYSSLLQVEGDASSTALASLTSSASNTIGGLLILGHHRSGSVGGNTVLQSGDQLGVVAFMGSDGSEQVAGAEIKAEVDGTPGANDMPSRLVFSTTADGASSPTERMRISQSGTILINGGPLAFANVAGDLSASGGAVNWLGVRDDTSTFVYAALTAGTGKGNLLVGYTSSNGAYKLQVNSQIFATSATIATSDGRYKENVASLSDCVDLVKALRPVSFNWKAQTAVTHLDEDGNESVIREAHNFPDGTHVGFIAQEVQTACAGKPWVSNLVKTNVRPAVTADDGTVMAPEEEFLGIAEGNLIAVLTAALQEAIAKIETLEANNVSLEARLAALEAN